MGAQTRVLRRIFAAVIAVLAMEMIYNGVAGGLK
jgi:small neutral amino acid transporter SnatA (MarC family)